MRPCACSFPGSLKTQAEPCFCWSNDSSRWRRDHAQPIQLKGAVCGASANGWRPGPVPRGERQILGMDTRGVCTGHLMPHAKTSIIKRMFSEKEIAYLQSQRLARIATVSSDGKPDVAPVGFAFKSGRFLVGGIDLKRTLKYTNEHWACSNCCGRFA